MEFPARSFPSLSKFLLVAAAIASSAVPAFAAASGTETSKYELGNVMFVGDSITHGVNSASYRWALHKILVDNGISYTSVGYKTGNYSGGVSAGTTYGGVAFNNVHTSQASARAWEISGRKSGSRFDGTNITNWLGQSDTTTGGSTYTGDTYDVDTFFMLIGTNDLLSDSVSSYETVYDNLLGSDRASGDIGTILDSMFESNSSATVYLLTIPCWTTHANSNDESYHEAVSTYNDELATFVSNYNSANGTNVVLIDINTGIIDVASETSFYGCSSMFNNPGTDGLHPNAQGDLIIAGNIAKALGYAGRTAGQTRLAGSSFETHISDFSSTLPSNVTLTGTSTTSDGALVLGGDSSTTSSLVATWASDTDFSSGFTVDFVLESLGDGSTDGWDTTTNLSITLGSDTLYGTLNINEAYIQWGDTVLYSYDMSTISESIRIAYVIGNALEGLSGGFYVWLGDQLIGEALSATSGSDYNGVTMTYTGSGTVTISSYSMDGTSAYAPTTTGITNTEDAFISSGAIVISAGEAQGVVDIASKIGSANEVTATASGTSVYAKTGSYTGSVYATVTDSTVLSGWYAAYGGSTGTTLTGDVGLILTGDCGGATTVFGAVNTGTVDGNVYISIDAENIAFTTFTSGTYQASVVGAYSASITGTFHLQISAGTFGSNIYGGIHTGSSNSIGSTEIYINGGTIEGSIYGGGVTGTIGTETTASASASSLIISISDDDSDDSSDSSGTATNVTITDGTVSGSVYGGGIGDTIYGDTSVTITGGTISGSVYGGGAGDTINGNASVTISNGVVGGSIYGGGSAGTITGNTSVTIIGDTVQIGGDVSAGGSGGTIAGDATLTIQDVTSEYTYTAKSLVSSDISGGSNVSGTRTLILDNVTTGSTALSATVSDFDAVSVVNGSYTTLTSLGGASTLTLEAGTTLTVSESVTTTSALSVINLGEGASLTIGLAEVAASALTVNLASTSFTLTSSDGMSEDTLSGITFLLDGEEVEMAIRIGDTNAQEASIILASSIPEPGAFGIIAGAFALAAAASRRRRKAHKA